MKPSRERNRGCSIVAVDKFIEATRDSGYKGTASAISELVDNSIQAGATRVGISIGDHDGKDTTEVSVRDNGCGMDPFTLRQALRFGGSSRFNDRRGIGRYGMGLPNSSFSQARRVTVYTWQHLKGRAHTRNVGRIYTTYADYDEIVTGRMHKVPRPRLARNAPSLCRGKSGTLVIWTGCDRLDNRRVSTICRKLHAELGRRFRHYLFHGVRITVNGDDVVAIDPLFLAPRARYSGATTFGDEMKLNRV